MPAAADDWRRMGQERYLPPGTTLTRTRYRAHSDSREHEHCVFCWATFIDPDFSCEHGRLTEEHPDVLTEGYTTTSQHARGANWRWVCPQCFDDFAEEFQWHNAQA